MPTLQLRRTSLFWFQGAWELGRVFAASCFVFVCLFVCLFVCQLPRWVIILFLSLTSGWGFLFFSFFFLFLFVFCFILCCFSFKKFDFPITYLGSGWFFFFFFFLVFCFVLFCFVFVSLKFFAFFHFCLFFFCFVLVFAFENSTPLISNGAPLSLFYYTDDGGHYVIDNFGFPCNSVKNLISIWNFTNTFIQDCKIIWEFQIRWGGTSLLRPLWRSWGYLKAYSLMSNRGRFHNLKKLIFFNISVVLL